MMPRPITPTEPFVRLTAIHSLPRCGIASTFAIRSYALGVGAAQGREAAFKRCRDRLSSGGKASMEDVCELALQVLGSWVQRLPPGLWKLATRSPCGIVRPRRPNR